MADDLLWARDGIDWPQREASRFVEAGGLRWHVQCSGSGPAVLLIHGTGAASHSWRGLAPLLATRCTVISPDLPGHGFSATPGGDGLSLPGMARALGSLLGVLQVKPVIAVGHSAGAAILARMSLDGVIAPSLIMGLNAALLPLDGPAGWLFSPAARLLSVLPLVPQLFALQARDRRAVERLIASTGSRIDARGIDLYARLVSSPRHVAGALGMMAHWDLWRLAGDLPRLRTRLALVVGDADRTVPPAEAQRVRSLLPGAEVSVLPGLGHLAHEEQPQAVADLLLADLLRSQNFAVNGAGSA